MAKKCQKGSHLISHHVLYWFIIKKIPSNAPISFWQTVFDWWRCEFFFFSFVVVDPSKKSGGYMLLSPGSAQAIQYWKTIVRKSSCKGKFMTPHWGQSSSLPFLQAAPSTPFWTLEGLFELTWRPSKALDLGLYIAFRMAEKQRHSQVWRKSWTAPS